MVGRRGFLMGCMAALASPLAFIRPKPEVIAIRGVPIKFIPAWPREAKMDELFESLKLRYKKQRWIDIHKELQEYRNAPSVFPECPAIHIKFEDVA